MVNPQHTLSIQTGLRIAQLPNPEKEVVPETGSDGFMVILNDSLRRKMEKVMVPKYIAKTTGPKALPRTNKTTRFHALELDLFVAQPRLGKLPHDKPNNKHVDLVGSGVYRTAKVPENYSLAHLAALVCFLMGWPLETSFDTWVREAGKSLNGNNCIEVWFCLVPNVANSNHQVDDKWTVLPKRRNQAPVKLKISEIFNPYGLLSNRLHAFSQRPHLAPGSLSVRIKCEGASLHSPYFSIDEPFAINGHGAPPATRLPRLRGLDQELKERLSTKKFEGWAFSYGFWDFTEGRIVSEVDVEGVHVWEIDSTSFVKRLDVLERRAAGNWMTDLEEHAVEFESDFMVIPKCIDAL